MGTVMMCTSIILWLVLSLAAAEPRLAKAIGTLIVCIAFGVTGGFLFQLGGRVDTECHSALSVINRRSGRAARRLEDAAR
jgi:hypothetical protein